MHALHVRAVLVVPLETVNTVFGSTETLFCLAVKNNAQPVLEWSSNAVATDVSNTITSDDLPMHTESISLSITVDSGYCGNYTCTETRAPVTLSETVRVDVGKQCIYTCMHACMHGVLRLAMYTCMHAWCSEHVAMYTCMHAWCSEHVATLL